MTSDAGCLNDKCMLQTEWKQKLPMHLTMMRIYLVLPTLALMFPNDFWFNFSAAILFIIASITDYYDGYFARLYQATSTMGKFMDPIADKILVNSILVLACTQQKIDPFLVIIIIARDTFIGGVRSVAAAEGLIIDAKATGKWKTALQMVAVPAVMIWSLENFHAWGAYVERLGYILLWISTLLSITSGVEYFNAYKVSKNKKKTS